MSQNKRRFSEIQIRFFAACIVIALEYIHSMNVLHRDVKPENIVLDQQGYLYLTDFGVARRWVENNSKDTSGTPGYLAPEVLMKQNHNKQVDYYALGVVLYELIIGVVSLILSSVLMQERLAQTYCSKCQMGKLTSTLMISKEDMVMISWT